MFLYLLFQLRFASEYFSSIKNLSVFAVGMLYFAVLPWGVGPCPSDLHPQALRYFLKQAKFIGTFFIIDELCSIVYLDDADFESHFLFQALQEFSCPVIKQYPLAFRSVYCSLGSRAALSRQVASFLR